MSASTGGTPSARAPMPRPVGAGLTHRGVVRERNEDSILTDPSGVLWAVADGMGGHALGDVASDMVIDALATTPDGGDPAAAMTARLEAANRQVHARAQEAGRGMMGSTAVAVMIDRAVAHVVWAGDSRAYLLRAGALRMLSRDHTVVQDMIARGELSADAAEHHPESHVITRAIGMGPGFAAEATSTPLVPGDRLLLCSDGLTACLSDQQIAARLHEAASPETACQALIADTLTAGAPDNVSVIVVFMDGQAR